MRSFRSINKHSDGLDKIDAQILHQLDVNARQPSAAIARVLEIPEETVRYRLRSLVERGTIVSTFTIIDAGLVGNSYFKVLVKLQNPRIEILQKIEAFLLNTEAVNWIARCEILYDLAFTIRVRQLSELNSFIDLLKNTFYSVLKELVFAVNVEVEFLSRDFLVGKERKPRRKSAYTIPKKERTLDEIDLKILRMLSKDARQSLRSLALECDCTDETISERLVRLEKEGVITGYRLVLNSEMCGISNYYILLYLARSNPRRTEELRRFLREEPSMSYVIKAIGPWDYELNLEAFEQDDYRSFMGTLTNRFSDLVRHWEAFPITKVHRLTLSP